MVVELYCPSCGESVRDVHFDYLAPGTTEVACLACGTRWEISINFKEIATIKERDNASTRQTRVLDVFLDGALPGLNAVIGANRSDKHAGARLKRKTDTAIVTELQALGCPPLPAVPLVWTFIWRCENKRRDPDNIASAAKFVFDALQRAGLLDNDGWGQVAELHHYFEKAARAGVQVIAHTAVH